MDTKAIETGYRSCSMPRYKHFDLNQTTMIPLSHADQVVDEVLLKVVLYGYYRGIISSRRIAEG
jgi:transposase